MPIYLYKCSACGYTQDVMQKMADTELTICPQCSNHSYNKQLTAAGFQLKGSGYYATDFKNSTPAPTQEAAAPAAESSSGTCPACN